MTLATDKLRADLYICPTCGNVRRAWGGPVPLCDRAHQHPGSGRVVPAPGTTNRGKISGVHEAVEMVRLFPDGGES